MNEDTFQAPGSKEAGMEPEGIHRGQILSAIFPDLSLGSLVLYSITANSLFLAMRVELVDLPRGAVPAGLTRGPGSHQPTRRRR